MYSVHFTFEIDKELSDDKEFQRLFQLKRKIERILNTLNHYTGECLKFLQNKFKKYKNIKCELFIEYKMQEIKKSVKCF